MSAADARFKIEWSICPIFKGIQKICECYKSCYIYYTCVRVDINEFSYFSIKKGRVSLIDFVMKILQTELSELVAFNALIYVLIVYFFKSMEIFQFSYFLLLNLLSTLV